MSEDTLTGQQPTPDPFDPQRRITALLASIPDDVQATFAAYYQERLQQARQEAQRAATGSLLGAADDAVVEAALLDQLEREADGREVEDGLGDVPAGDQVLSIPIPETDPRAVGVTGSGATPPLSRQAQALRWGGIALAVLGILWSLGQLVLPQQPAGLAAPASSPTSGATAPALAEVAPPNDTAFWYPVSLELPSGAVLRVTASAPALGGNWTPELLDGTAAWLEGTFVNSVFCLPPALERTLAALERGQPILLRTASGVVRAYRVTAVRTVQRQQTELLSQQRAGLTLLACGVAGNNRTAIEAEFQPPVVGRNGRPTTTP